MTKTLNYNILQPLSKHNSINKNTAAITSPDLLLALMDLQSNFEEYIRNQSIYDASSIILAENDWLNRNNKTTYQLPIAEGDVYKIDFGKAYRLEMSYIHYGLCIKAYKNKLLVIPMTTSPAVINKAYHPADNSSGDFSLRMAKPEEGFAVTTALFMHSAQFISKNRIISLQSHIDHIALDAIQSHLFSAIFPQIRNKYFTLQKDFAELNGDYAALVERHSKLSDEHLKLLELHNNPSGISAIK